MPENTNFLVLPKRFGCTHEDVITLTSEYGNTNLNMFGGRIKRDMLFLRCVDCEALFAFKKEELKT